MDVLTIQWGWIGGYPTQVAPTPTPSPTMGVGGFSDFYMAKFPDEDEEGLMIVLLGLLEDDK